MKSKILLILLLLNLISFPAFGGVDFDGLDDSVRISNTSGAIDGMTDMTISCWFNVDQQGDSAFPRLMRKARTAVPDGDNSYWELHLNLKSGAGTGILQFRAGYVTTVGIWNTDDAIFNFDEWNHFLVVYTHDNVNNNPTFYLNGDSITVNETSTPGGPTLTDTSFMRLGDWGTRTRSLDGLMTEVAVWDTRLTASEAALLGKSKIKGMPYQIQPGNLVGYWSLDEVANDVSANNVTFVDRSGSGNDGIGDDGDNNTGMLGKAEEVLSYDFSPIIVTRDAGVAPPVGAPQVIMITKIIQFIMNPISAVAII